MKNREYLIEVVTAILVNQATPISNREPFEASAEKIVDTYIKAISFQENFKRLTERYDIE